jgi:hypothetical protein
MEHALQRITPGEVRKHGIDEHFWKLEMGDNNGKSCEKRTWF